MTPRQNLDVLFNMSVKNDTYITFSMDELKAAIPSLKDRADMFNEYAEGTVYEIHGHHDRMMVLNKISGILIRSYLPIRKLC